MTAHELIADIFARPQSGMPSNMRYITQGQLDFLRNLIGQDEEGGAVNAGMNGGFLWKPSGRWKYMITVDPQANKRTLTRIMTLTPTGAGTLFG